MTKIDKRFVKYAELIYVFRDKTNKTLMPTSETASCLTGRKLTVQ